MIGRISAYFIPPGCLQDPELARRAQLLTGFGTLGGLFGLVYAIFYLLIGHHWGVAMIVFCTSGVALTPFLMRWTGSIRLAGHIFSLILILGFTGLCFVEGGLHGHAIAWLVSVPLCVLLMVDRKAAARWVLVTFSAAGVIMGIDLAGYKLPNTYDPQWHSIVSGVGYLGLIAFMFILGQIFEQGRARAFARMQATLRELAASNERLVHLNQEKNEFMGIAAHDLKNPLSAVIMCADLLQMGLPHEKSMKLAGDISAAGTRMRDLIKNLLDANAIEQGKFNSNIEHCDLDALTRQCVENNRVTAARKKIEVNLTDTAGVFARADKGATMQILDNLLSNAIKYSPPGSVVNVRLGADATRAWVSVKDSGPGISEADQKKLFQKFTRLSAKPTAGESSNGLGLSIVKRLAEAMSGSVRCESVLGAGATFSLLLPVSSEAASSPAQRAA
jgi:signal transduction histidine kinase